MNRALVIVESPAKAKTIKKYLGKGFEVMACYGHVRDLIPKEGAVDPAHDFAMHYEAIARNQKHVKAISDALKKCDALLLAPDPDREGEAIAWHLKELLQKRGSLKEKTVERIVFNQITKNAIQEAIKNPREISMDLVNAQQARRALDFLVGFNLSPLLWKKVRAGLSAGRVQSPALRLIVEREEEIEKFISQEYWTIHADLQHIEQAFSSRLITYQGNKVEQFSFVDEKTAHQVVKELTQLADGKLTVANVVKKERKRNPSPPFITATLQQEASRKLGMSTSQTMRVAQQLYEGVDIDEGSVGLITYMRTDSVNLAAEAITEIRECIQQEFGANNLPDAPRLYKTKSKNAQEAHEGIRPTSALRTPQSLKKYLDRDQLRLYTLIWQRTLASQMISATVNTVAVDLQVAQTENMFRANGSVIVDPGFLLVYQEDQDDPSPDDQERKLPQLQVGEAIPLEKIAGEQHFTEPPPRYSEASLVKALEEFGIGRPSTYASIIATLKNRKYVTMENKRFYPSDVGRVVNYFLTHFFERYVDYAFTANLEDELDAVARGDKQWIPLLQAFWDPFKTQIDDTEKNVKRSDVTQQKIDEKCPECGEILAIRLGRSGRFIGCTNYPECRYTRDVHANQAQEEPEKIDRPCPLCQHELVVKRGRYGKFIGCSQYPKCKHIEPLEKPTDTEVTCPKCKSGTILERKSRKGKIFYSCSDFPKCDYAIWYPPLDKPCPQCQWPILMLKETKKLGRQIVCPQPECDYAIPAPEEDDE